ncbi:hypothetical protein [Marinicella sp. W31]|uniref:hypothetical protein n=1 Tax=Marinicella sp. W31 TaxID=3023713 RepID=UPI003756C863
MSVKSHLPFWTLWMIITLSGCQQYDEHTENPPTQPQPPQEIIACTPDLKSCPDGTQVERNPNLNCAFNPCDGSTPEELTMCTMDVKECPDGSYVNREPKNNCAFADCPNTPN